MLYFSNGSILSGAINMPSENLNDWVEISEYESLSWTERSHEPGEFKLILISESLEPNFGTYKYVARDDSPTVMIIEDITAKQLSSGKFQQIYSGRSLETMLEWRVTPHKLPIYVNDDNYFDAQTWCEQVLHSNFGPGATARRRIPGFNVWRDSTVNSVIKPDIPNGFANDEGLMMDRDNIAAIVKKILSQVKPNGFPMFYTIQMRTRGFWVEFKAPYLVEPVLLSPDSDFFSEFEYVWSNRKKYSMIYEVYEHYETDTDYPADGKSRTQEIRIRNEQPMLRREVLWNNSGDHKVVDPNDKNSHKTSKDSHGLNAYDYSNTWYINQVAADKAGEYTPKMEYSAKFNTEGQAIRYREDYFVGDVFRYIPNPDTGTRRAIAAGSYDWETYASNRAVYLQLTEMTETWDSSGYTIVPAFTGYDEKWSGRERTVSIERNQEYTYRAYRSR